MFFWTILLLKFILLIGGVMYSFFCLFFLFLVYSLIGYVIEVFICSIENEKLTIHRGFLAGPYLPIFGFGALVITLFLSDYKSSFGVVFFLGMLICGFLEYLTSWIMEKIFHNKWWDYAGHVDNINGRITITNCIGFGIGAVLIINVFNPLFHNIINIFHSFGVLIVGSILFVVVMADFIYSVLVAYGLRNRIIVVEELKARKMAVVPEVAKKYLEERWKHFRITSDRLFKSFPKLMNNKEVGIVKEAILELKEEKKVTKKKK